MAYTVVDLPTDYFNTKLYVGNGGTQSITGVGFAPDWVWTKNRSTTDSHELYDTVRGATKRLISHSTAAENTETYFSSFDSDGFTLTGNGNSNGNGNNIVAWCWDANGTGVSNTAGTITSTVSANTTSGFSIVSYTGTGATATVGHGLGSIPKMIIFKKRSGADNWVVYHSSVGNTAYLLLDQTSGSATSSGMFNNTSPTSSVFTVSTAGPNNGSGATFIAYCFAEVKGYSKFGSYTGNGSADGTFVYTGFKPAWLMIKSSSVGGTSWNIWDNKRTPINAMFSVLSAESSNAEYTDSTYRSIDFTSQGFKIRVSAADLNTSSATYIYMAFAENPFVSSGGIPTTAR